MISDLTPAMSQLISTIGESIAGRAASTDGAAADVAHALGSFLPHGGLLTAAQSAPDPQRYRQHLIYGDPGGAFSIASLVWLPGQSTPIHDHVCWCVVGVLKGWEHETRFTTDANGANPVPVSHSINTEGSTSVANPPVDVHQVANRSGDTAISLHIYGCDLQALKTSIRRVYDPPLPA
ncbi:hypothetical protein [Micromonospora echinospora]|uniref:cysteine dioxygenase family protein n=1 Tax=Micromonospora echinospora TaxID=1877 RepID=UPI003A84421C